MSRPPTIARTRLPDILRMARRRAGVIVPEIAAWFGLSEGNARQLVRRLVRDGILVRERWRRNRRDVFLRPGPGGWVHTTRFTVCACAALVRINSDRAAHVRCWGEAWARRWRPGGPYWPR